MKTRVPMSERILCAIAVALLAWPALAATPAPRSVIRIPVSRSEVVPSPEDLRTVAIADPRIADAAVGSARTVLVTAKSPGTTTLVLYSNTGSYSIHEIRVFSPNAERQVLLHVRVAEVSEEGKRQLGVDWYGRGERSNIGTIEGGLFTAKVAEPALPPTIGSRTDGILSYANPGGGLKLLSTWRALEEKGEIRTLANPSLLARSGEKAEFLAGGEIPVPIATSAGVAGGASVTIEWKPFGVGVVFTPRVLDDDRIQLSVAPEVSQLDYSNAVTLSGFTVPSLVSRKVSTTVELASGEHLVIGGLRQTERTRKVSRIPLLGRVPLLGALFSSSQIDTVSRELLLVVSPELQGAASRALPVLPTDGTPADSTGAEVPR